MGPKMAVDALRKCVSYGADDAILITDRVFAGSDTLATSYALASAIRTIGKEQPVDMVFCGKQTIDGDTATNDSVTVRDRDSMLQERVSLSALSDHLGKKLENSPARNKNYRP